jgi:hypothetical protein
MKYNRIEFRVFLKKRRASRYKPGIYYPGFEIHVDGRDFLEIVRETEAGFVSPELVGDYRSFSVEEYLPPSGRLFGFGEVGSWELTGEPLLENCVIIYVCGTCGDPDCWPLMVRIETDADEVRWPEVFNPWGDHRYAKIINPRSRLTAEDSWHYPLSFTFRRKSYEGKLERLQEAYAFLKMRMRLLKSLGSHAKKGLDAERTRQLGRDITRVYRGELKEGPVYELVRKMDNRRTARQRKETDESRRRER